MFVQLISSPVDNHAGSLRRLAAVIKNYALLFADSVTGYINGYTKTERIFEDIIREHDAMIVKICFGYAQTTDELNDLHQDALINIWQGLPRFKGSATLKTWIYRVTLNTCVSTLRNRKRHIQTSRLEELYAIIDEDDYKRQLIAEMHECILKLSPIDKAIVLLWLDEFNYDEISATVGLPRNTVASRLRRAKEKLKSQR